jgi:hypothetical protein
LTKARGGKFFQWVNGKFPLSYMLKETDNCISAKWKSFTSLPWSTKYDMLGIWANQSFNARELRKLPKHIILINCKLLYLVSIFSVLLPLMAGMILFKKLEINSKLIVVLVTFATVPQLVAFFESESNPQKTVFYNLYTLFDSLILAYIFFRNSETKIVRKSIQVIITIQVGIVIWSFGKFGLGDRFRTEFVCLNSILQILWVLTYFYERYVSEKIGSIEKEPMFWFCLGILIYAPTTYFLFVFYDVIRSSKEPQYNDLWDLHHLLNTCMYVLYTVGISINLLRPTNSENASRQY